MYNTSDEFKTAIKGNPRQILSYLTVGDVTYDDEVQSVNISAQSTDGDIIGQAICQSFDAELLLTAEQYSAFNPSDEVTLYFGIVLSSTTEYVPQGKFLIKSYSYDADKGKFKMSCVDYMAEFDKYQVKELPMFTYPLTVDDYLTAICVKAGVIKSAETYWGNNTILTQAPNFSGTESLREALKGLAQMCLANCCMNKAGKLKMSCIVDSTAQSITADDYYTATFGERIIPINTVSLVRDPANDIIYAKDQAMINVDGVSDLSISNNPFMDNDRATFANKLLNKVKGLSLYPCEIDWRGNFALEPFEKLSVTAVDNTVKTAYLFNRETAYNGGLREKISCKGYNKKVVQYAKGSTIQDKLRNAEISVDKVNQRIDLLAENSYTKEQVDTEITSAVGVSEGEVKIYVDEKTALKSATYTAPPSTHLLNDTLCPDKNYTATDGTIFEQGKNYIATSGNTTPIYKTLVFSDGKTLKFSDGKSLVFADMNASNWDKRDKYQTDTDVSASLDVKSEAIRMDFQNGGLSSKVQFDVGGIHCLGNGVEVKDNSGNKVFGVDTNGNLGMRGYLGDMVSTVTSKTGRFNAKNWNGETIVVDGLGLYSNGVLFGGIYNLNGYILFQSEGASCTVTCDSGGLTFANEGMHFKAENYGHFYNGMDGIEMVSEIYNSGLIIDGLMGNVRLYLNNVDVLRATSTNLYTDCTNAYFKNLYTNNIQVTSDRELKKDIKQNTEYALDKLKNVNFYGYTINKPIKDKDGKATGEFDNSYSTKIGLMHDECPDDIATTEENGEKHIDLYASISIAIKAVQELNKKIDRQAVKISDLESENTELRKLIEREKLERKIVTKNIKKGLI